jgi:hypothetical protein
LKHDFGKIQVSTEDSWKKEIHDFRARQSHKLPELDMIHPKATNRSSSAKKLLHMLSK